MKKLKLSMITFAIFIAFMCLGSTNVQADTRNITSMDEMLRIVFQNYIQPENSPNASLVDGVITLNRDISTDNCGNIISGNYEIDLNGHTIYYNQSSGNSFFEIGANSSIIIGDSTNTPGGISTTGELRALYLFSVNGGSLTINKGNYTNTASNWYDGLGIVQVNSGTATINGGTFTTRFDSNVDIRGGNLEINNGTFVGAQNSIKAHSTNNSINSIIINNGTFTSRLNGEDEIAFRFNQLNGVKINGGKFTGAEYAFLYYDENQNTTVTPEEISAVIGTNSKVAGGMDFSKIYYRYSTLQGYVSGKTIEVEQKQKYDIVLTANVTGGTVSVSDLKPYEDSKVTINIQPVNGYKLKDIKILKYIDNSNVKSSLDYNATNNTFTMPKYSIKVIPEFELIIPETSTVTQTEDDITISAKGAFRGNPELVIIKTTKGNEGYNSLITLIKEDKQLLGSYDVSITGGEYVGDLDLTFTVGKQYEANTITVYHKLANGKIEVKTAVVKDGTATITVNELSPFMLAIEKEAVAKKDETPKTGVNINQYSIIFMGIALVGIFITNKLIKNNKK